jgi:hypothetical protein
MAHFRPRAEQRVKLKHHATAINNQSAIVKELIRHVQKLEQDRDALAESLAEAHLRILFLLKHTVYKERLAAGLLGVNGQAQERIVTAETKYKQHRDDFAEKVIAEMADAMHVDLASLERDDDDDAAGDAVSA